MRCSPFLLKLAGRDNNRACSSWGHGNANSIQSIHSRSLSSGTDLYSLFPTMIVISSGYLHTTRLLAGIDVLKFIYGKVNKKRWKRARLQGTLRKKSCSIKCSLETLERTREKSLWILNSTYMANDGRQVVLAKGEHFNILDNDHFIVVLVENGIVQQICSKGGAQFWLWLKSTILASQHLTRTTLTLQLNVVATSVVAERLGRPLRCLDQTLATHVLAHVGEQ